MSAVVLPTGPGRRAAARRRVAAVTAVAAAAALAVLPGHAGAAGSGPAFGVPVLVDPIHVYGEPDIAVNPRTGALHVSGPQGTGSQRSIWNVSLDGGRSYRLVQNLPANTYASAAQPTKTALGPGGGDTEISIARNGRTFFNDLAALTSFTAVTTTDDGRTTSMANASGIPALVNGVPVPKPLGDRQWFALFDPTPADHTISPYRGAVPANYLSYADQANGDQVALSTNGTDYSLNAGLYANDGVHNPDHGVPVVDQHTGHFLALSSDNANGGLALVNGTPDATGALTFRYTTIARTGSPEQLFPVLTEDTARTLYAVWVDATDDQVYYSWARPDRADSGTWSHWSPRIRINRPPAATNIFPWARAGGPGILDVAWYGTDKTLAQLGSAGPSAKAGQVWWVYFAQLTGAAGTAPGVAQVRASQHPWHYNDICLLGTACVTAAGNRNQADFFKLALDNDGRARIVFTDTSNAQDQLGNIDSAADHLGAALDTVVTQQGGLNAWTGQPLQPQRGLPGRAPLAGVTAPAGDDLFKPLGGTPLPGADLTGVRLRRVGDALVVTLSTAGGSLASAATAAGAAAAELTVRWQYGRRLYHAGVEETATGTRTFYAGQTATVDLCSVSACKPNYLQYGAPPTPGTVTVNDGTADVRSTAGLYQFTVPLSAVGSPGRADVLEEVTAFATVSPAPAAVPLDSARAFADQVPVEVDAVAPFNFVAAASTAPVTLPAESALPRTAGAATAARSAGAATAAGTLATTGLSAALPLTALLAAAGAAVLLRRRTRRRQTGD